MAAKKKKLAKRAKPAPARTKKKQAPRKRSALLDSEKLAFGARLRARREALGMSAKALSEGVVITNHLYLVERGRYVLGTPALRLIAERLGVTQDWLLLGKE